jgi:hypothetical protein
MTDAGPLFVPMRLDAAVFARRSSAEGPIRRWTMNYGKVGSPDGVEQAPFLGSIDTTVAANQGVYLMWTLPAALRHGVQDDPKSGALTFPEAPNRWLVVRAAAPTGGEATTTAWIVESDFLSTDPKQATSPYLLSPDPKKAGSKQQATFIGRKLALKGGQPWVESNPKETFLTAVAPGNAAFTAFQPHNQDVFSIHDLLEDVTSAATLHYFVAGWHAHPDDDRLSAARQAKAGGYAPLLAELGWAAPDPDTRSATSCVFHGLVLGVKWERDTGTPPSSKRRDDAKPQVALGATGTDALSAFLKAQQVDKGSVDLLRAFALDLLSVLQQPGGEAILKRHLHDARFGSSPGGIQWEIVDKTTSPDEPPPPPPTAKELDAERKWLQELNSKQAELDGKRRDLASLQRQLYELWWKRRRVSRLAAALLKTPLGLTDKDFAPAFDQNSPTSLAGRVAALLAELQPKPGDPPAPTADFAGTSAEDYASAQKIKSTRQLVAGLAPRFFTAADPVLLVSGVGRDPATDPDTLLCRYADGVLGGAGANAPAIAAKGLPPIEPLLAEFAFLQGLFTTDRKAFAAAVAKTNLLQPSWEQPWLPLYLEWQVEWHDLPFVPDGDNAAQWTFDGRDFVFTGKAPPATELPRPAVGRTLLTPGLTDTLASRLAKLVGSDPQSTRLRGLSDTVKRWDFLSQRLDGLTTLLAKRDPSPAPAPAPTDPVRSLLEGQYPRAPEPGQDTALHGAFEQKATSSFEGMRAGQFTLTQVSIVDRFGQVLEVPDDLLAAAPGLVAPHPIPSARNELPPRLLQGARLRFTAVDEQSGKDVAAGVDPICGFLVPDHVSRALAVHDPAGARLGELRLVVGAKGRARIRWDPEPSRTHPTIPGIANAHPRLAAVLRAITTPGAFRNFLTVIDETLWTIDPLAGGQDDYLTALAGRPLALVRARLAFELNGEPIRDPDWPFTFAPVDPPFLHYDFPVRLGAAADREDGLVGYFIGTDKSFHAVHMPGKDERVPDKSKFVKAARAQDIHLRFDGATRADVTLLVDPRAKVFARTGLLPSTVLELRAANLAPALDAISIAYRAGPLLADSPGAPLMPTPTASGRRWSWVEHPELPTGPVPFPAVDDRARFPASPVTVREGFVQIDPAVKEVTK